MIRATRGRAAKFRRREEKVTLLNALATKGKTPSWAVRGEGQLESQVKEAEGIQKKQDEGTDGDRVDEIDVSPDKLAEEKSEGHDRSSHDRRSPFHQEGIKQEKGHHQQVRNPGGNSHQPEKGKEEKRNDGDMGPGYGKKMVDS